MYGYGCKCGLYCHRMAVSVMSSALGYKLCVRGISISEVGMLKSVSERTTH